MSQLVGKTAVITGASAGIGAATASHLASLGASVVLAARRRDRLAKLENEINRAAGGRALAAFVDVGSEESIAELSAKVQAEFGAADLLVNNAGYGYFAPVQDIEADKLDRLLAVNLRGAVLCAKHFLPGMLARRQGTIVNVGSISAQRGYASGTPYVASKFALRGFSECLWEEVRGANIRVCHLMLDFVRSEFFEASGVDLEEMERAIPPQDVAQAIAAAFTLPQATCVVELIVRPNVFP